MVMILKNINSINFYNNNNQIRVRQNKIQVNNILKI